MNLIINGERVTVEQVSHVADLLKFFKMENKVVIVEVNSTIIQKENHGTTLLHDGDKVELVHFVGGG